MANQSTLERLGDCVGTVAALKLCARWGGRTLYVPGEPMANDHPIVALIGPRLAADLQQEFGSETLSIPTAEFRNLRRYGLAEQMAKKGIPHSVIGLALGIGPDRVRQLLNSATAELNDPEPVCGEAQHGGL